MVTENKQISEIKTGELKCQTHYIKTVGGHLKNNDPETLQK